MAEEKLLDILIDGKVPKAIMIDINDNDVKVRLKEINKKQEELLKLKELDQDRFRMVVNL